MKDGLQIEEMKNAADSVVGTLKSLANTDRLLILCHLAHEELNVSQIEEKTQITQPTLSQQLMMGEFKHEVRQFEKSYDNQQAEQISLMV